MSDGVFVKVGEGRANFSGKTSHPKYKSVYFANESEGKNMGEYAFDHAQAGQQGTLVPVGKGNGSIEGKDSRSVYGQVVTGYRMGYQEGVGEIAQGEFVPDYILEDRAASGRGSVIPTAPVNQTLNTTPPVPVSQAPAGAAVVQPNIFEDEHLSVEEQEHVERCMEEKKKALEMANAQGLHELLYDDTPSEPPTVENTFRKSDQSDWQEGSNMTTATPTAPPQQQPAPQPAPAQHGKAAVVHAPAPAPEPVKLSPLDVLKFEPAKVTMQGIFGKFRTNCAHVITDPSYIALIVDNEEPIFTPPPDTENPITLSCGEYNYTVCFIGTEFELGFINYSIQVFHRE